MVTSNHGEYESVSGNGIKVAILDSGVSASDDLPVKERVNFIDGEDDIEPLYEDLSGHGTGVAGVIIGKDNGWGVTGVNPNANLYSLRVLDGTNKAPLSRIVSAIYWCIDNDINIMNMSFGTTTRSAILENAIRDADEAGILMIAAVGNHGMEDPDVVEYPAAFDEVMAVGAVNPQGQISDLSSIGSVTEILAPGESIPVMDFLDQISPADGTSMATPHITGIASLIWAKDETKSGDFVRELMKASTRSIDAGDYGVADLDYALQIYDSFAEQYAENPHTAFTSVSANTLLPDTYDDTQVEALWYHTDHQSAIDLSTSITSGVKNIIKIAQYAADNDSSLKGTNALQKRFHGHFNYVANYVYMMRIARKVYNCGSISTATFNNAIDSAIWPTSEVNTDSEDIIKSRLKTLSYSTYLSQVNKTDNANNRGRFIVGLALHSAMDAYAHEAYISSGSGYARIEDWDLQDMISYIPNRYNVAKDVAVDIIDVWHYGSTPDELEFYQTSHNGGLFRLGNLRYHAKKVNPNMSQSDETWYTNHGYDHS
ncbi:MAG: S8 family serine peptidase [Lachnospiraceae bacterium]|nr:S8 family serine peptidase [Lachnospiraceae bacterium]